ncbi:MAG TPA: tape measure protein, partial [Streptosporangiaceae bacterium]
MSDVIGEATIKVGADASGFESSLGKETASAGPGIGSRLASGIGSVLKKGAVVSGAAVAGILGTSLVKGFQRLNAIDQAKAKLTGLGHSAGEVNKIMDNALAAVQGTAYGLGDAASQAATMVAAGVKPGKDLTHTLSLLADTATITGASMGEVGSIFGKVAANNKLTLEAVGQLQDRGVPVLKMVADQFGVTMAKASEMVSNGKVDFETFQKAMDKGLGGAALASGKTFQGALANTGAALSRFGAAILGPIFEKIPKLLGNAITWIDKFTEAAGPIGSKIGKVFGQAFRAVMNFVQSPAVKRVVVEWFNRIKNAAQVLWGQLQKLWPKVKAVATVVGGVLVGAFKTLGPLLAGAAMAIGQRVIPALTAVFGFLSKHKTTVKVIVYAIIGYLALMGAAWVKQGVQALIGMAKNVVAWVTTATAA